MAGKGKKVEAVAYIRTSSAANVGADKDSDQHESCPLGVSAFSLRQDAQLLRHQLAGEPRCVLDNDRPDTIVLDPIQQGREAGADLNRVRTSHCGIVELIDQHESCPLGVALNGSPLSLVAVLVGPDICSR